MYCTVLYCKQTTDLKKEDYFCTMRKKNNGREKVMR